MEDDLKRLLDDSRFLDYHERSLKREDFNPFNVLRYADYEVRHSNVLAWLLQPAESHGIGGAFLKWFLEQHNEKAGSRAGSIRDALEANDVRIERELDYVDVSVFLDQKHLIAIENKTVGAESQHFEQVRAYEKKLREKHGQNCTIHSVLLTTSSDGAVSEPDFVHMSWSSVIDRIRSLEGGGAFSAPDVSAFIRQYLDAVGKWLVPDQAGEDHIAALRVDYDSLWKRLFDVLAHEGDEGVAKAVSTHGSDCGRTLVRLVKALVEEPRKLRDAAKAFLQRKELTTWAGQSSDRKEFTVHWASTEPARALGIEPSCLRWALAFGYEGVRVVFYVHPWHEESRPLLERITAHIRDTPINEGKPNWYPMEYVGSYFEIHRREFLSAEDLKGVSTSRAKDVMEQKLTELLDAADSEYRRIATYFKCLAFRPDAPESPEEEVA